MEFRYAVEYLINTPLDLFRCAAVTRMLLLLILNASFPARFLLPHFNAMQCTVLRCDDVRTYHEMYVSLSPSHDSQYKALTPVHTVREK